MSVVVAYKYAVNPQDARVAEDGSIDWSRAKAAVSEYDPAAITFARGLADQLASELVGISVGTAVIASSAAKSKAMATGLDRGIVVADDAVADLNPTAVAELLSQLVPDDAEVLITGDASTDAGGRVTSGLLAGYLGWPCIQEVTAIAKDDDGYLITQRIPGGQRTVRASGKIVIAAASDAATPLPPSMKEILAAKKKPVEVIDLSSLTSTPVDYTVTGTAKPEKQPRKNNMYSTAAELAAALRTDGIL